MADGPEIASLQEQLAQAERRCDAIVDEFRPQLERLPALETENATLRDLNAEHERSKEALVAGYREQISRLTEGNTTKAVAAGESDTNTDEYGNATKINLGDDVLAALTTYAAAHGQTEAEAITTLILKP